jgi:hypothetical protein
METHYYDIQGLMEPIRYLIAHLALNVTEVNHESFATWSIVKAEMQKQGVQFANLPLLRLANG